MLVKTNNFSEIKNKVTAIKQTENSYLVKNMNSAKRRNLLDVAKYSGYGLSAAGVRLGFPASFVGKYGLKHPDGAKKILTDCYEDFFEKLSSSERQDDKVDGRKSTALFVRDFDDVHCGILTDKYSVFDDDEVVDILSKNKYLMNAEEFWYNVSPERFHARFVSSNKLSVDGDPSPLSMAVFVDNSMCGASSFRIRFGIYRWACTNGMISGLKEFEIAKEMHKGEKDYVSIVAKALENAETYEALLLDMVENAIATKSAIYELTEDQAMAYIQKKLNVGKKASEQILENYYSYGGESKWHLVNAITDYAHMDNLDTRIQLEEKAFKVA